MYSEKVMDHFSNPRNVGAMEDADGIGEVDTGIYIRGCIVVVDGVTVRIDNIDATRFVRGCVIVGDDIAVGVVESDTCPEIRCYIIVNDVVIYR